MINSLSRYLVLSSLVLLASCKGDGKKDVVMKANQSGNITRAHWQTERKPIVIETDTLPKLRSDSFPYRFSPNGALSSIADVALTPR